MQWLANVSIDRPVFTWVMSLALLVLGFASIGSLPVDRFPNVDIPVVTVVTPYPGASPEQVEIEVTELIEEAVNAVSGLSELRSTSYEGLSVVFIQFELEKDVDVAAQEVRDRVNRVLGDLPAGLDPPRIEKIDPDATPLYYIAVRGPGTAQELTEFVKDELKTPLEGLSGVGSIQLLGERERAFLVTLDPAKLDAHQLTPSDVAGALSRENIELPGGNIDNGPRSLQVRVPGRVLSAEELGRITIAKQGDHAILLRDLADVVDGASEIESLVTLDGEDVILVTVTRQSGTNAIAVADALDERIGELKERLPPGYQVDVVRDESGFARTSVHAVQEHLMLGAIFAVLVVMTFLKNGRATVIAALAIPISIIATFAVLKAMDLTLNMITLLALTLAVGIVIDDAIVVIENIMRYLEERKLDPKKAARDATKDIGLAVLATTLSLVAVFLPVVFMGGIVGRFLGSFGITMSVAVMISLFVAFSLTPMLGAKWLKSTGEGVSKRPKPEHEEAPLLSATEERARYREHFRGESGFELEDGFLERAYGKILAFSMERRWLIGLIMIGSLFAVPLIASIVPTSFMPDDDEGRFDITIEAPLGTSLAETEIISERLARRIRLIPEVRYTVVMTGSPEGDISGRGDNESLIYVALAPHGERKRSAQEIIQYIRDEELPPFIEATGVRAAVSQVSPFGTSGPQAAPIQYLVRGPDLERLEQYADELVAVLQKQRGVAQADHTYRVGRPEIRVEIDRARAGELGVSVASIAETLRILIGGQDVTKLALDGKQFDVNLRAGEDHRRQIADLERYKVRAADGRLIPLSQVTRIDEGRGPSAIQRVARDRSILIYAYVTSEASTANILRALDETVESFGMPAGYSTLLTGQAKEFEKAAAGFALAIVLSFVFMYLIIAAQFESWIYPISIMSSLPLTVPFALLSLAIFGQSLNLFSMLGLLVLFGIVKKNSILQIDHTLTLRREGFTRPDAIMLANRDRLRPILMTTLAFVAGMIPLLLSRGAGAGTNHAIAGIVLGGQTLALLLTLIGTPVIYTWLDDLQLWTNARLDALRAGVGRMTAGLRKKREA